MKKRTKQGQKKHDQAVLNSAIWYENKGFKVNADLPNYKKPKKINSFIPDLIAKKGNAEIILEIETKESNKKDLKQQSAFKTYAQKNKAEFKKKII